MRSKMALGTKLTASFAALLIIILAVSYFALTSLSTIKQTFDTAADTTVRKIALADEINIAESDMLAWQRGTLLKAFVKDLAQMEASKQKFLRSAEILQKSVAEMKPLAADERAKQALKRMEEETTAWVSHFEATVQLCAAGKFDEGYKYATDKTIPLYDSISKDAELVAQIEQDSLAKDKKTGADEYAQSRWVAFLMIGLGFVVGAVVLVVVRSASSQLRQMAHELSQGSEQVASAAAQVSSASQSLAQGASEQAASLEETSASSEEMASMTRRNAENAKSAADLMTQAAQSVGEANRTLEQMVKSMNDINSSSDKISKIIKVIDEIAFQTNILALNAAVEAARAGEAGMGFAVVADEVRNLAQRSAQAAKDTAALIEESIAKSGEGRTKLDEVAKSITAITENANKVKTLVDEVNLGSQEQARGIEQVSKAVSQMEQVTQKTAANAEESASASEEMAAQAETTQAIVEQLQALVGGDGAGTGVAHRRKAVSTAVRSGASKGLGALKAAVHKDHKQVETGAKQATHELARAGKNAFPLEENFKEF